MGVLGSVGVKQADLLVACGLVEGGVSFLVDRVVGRVLEIELEIEVGVLRDDLGSVAEGPGAEFDLEAVEAALGEVHGDIGNVLE